jgi:hypothetical protein
VEYAKKYIGRYFIGQLDGLPAPFEEHYGYLNCNPWINKPAVIKTKRCSIIFSNKQFMEGHQYRNRIVEAILKTDLPVDIWGRGCQQLHSGDTRIKGEFAQNSVAPYEDYDFHICIENVSLNHYFSEKIVNALLAECTPIYLGCKKIDEYFPGQIVHLKGDIEEDMNIIQRCLEQPDVYRKNRCGEQVNKKVNPFFHVKTWFS